METQAIQSLASEVAQILGATLNEDRGDSWRATITTADGINLIFSTWNKKTGEIWAYVPRDTPRMSEKCGEIGVAFSRGAAAVAKEIEKRLLPGARIKAAAARERWASLDTDAAGLRLLADELGRLPHTRAEFHNPGDQSQRVRFNFFESSCGSVSGEISATGVHLERAAIYGPDHKGKLIRLLSAMRGA